MKYEHAKELLDGWTYKDKSWILDILKPKAEWNYAYEHRLVIQFWAPDATGKHYGNVVLKSDQPIPLDHFDSDLSFWQFIRTAVLAAEVHEMDEWFQVKGVAIFDPHATPK